MSDQLDIVDELELNVSSQKRTTFLTVLCILTWVGSGLSLLYYGIMYFSMALIVQNVTGENKYSNWMGLNLIAGLIAPVLTILGAVFMWRLRKWGFIMYVTGEMGMVVMSFLQYILLYRIMNEGLLWPAFTSLIPIGFTIMYALNLKHMRW